MLFGDFVDDYEAMVSFHKLTMGAKLISFFQSDLILFRRFQGRGMPHSLWFFAILAFFSVIVWETPAAATSKNQPSEVEIKFISKRYDFGTIFVGETVKHDFAFRNTGDSALLIKRIEAG